MRPVSARERRLVALLILVAAIAASWFAIVSPVIEGFSERAERREALKLRYLHNQRTIASIPRLRRQAENAKPGVLTFVIVSPTVNAGREILKARLHHVVERSGGEIQGVDDAEGAPGWARVTVAARMSLQQLTSTLDQLQNTPPWLVVDTLSVEANDALVTGQSSSMDVHLDVAIPFRASAP